MSGLATSQPDVTLLLDRDGVIREATLSDAVAGEQVAPWLGRPWEETVASVTTQQVRRMLADAANSGVSAFGEVTQRFPSGLELPMEYTTVRLGKRGGLIAVGKSTQAVAALQARLMAAQQAREQDYWKLREVETRYRLLFDTTQDAVLLLSAETMRVVEANPAAMRALHVGHGQELLPEFNAKDQLAVRALLHRAREHGRVPSILVHLGASGTPWALRASLTRDEPGPAYLLQLTAVGAAPPAPPAAAPPPGVDGFIDRLPDGFVLLDRDGVVCRANPAFVDLVEQGAEAAVVGQSFGHWLNQPGMDMQALLSQLNRYGSVRLFTAKLSGALGGECEVEISAAGNAHAVPPGIAMVVRNIARRPAASAAETGAPVTDQVGKLPLNSLVTQATETIERSCILEALAQTHGNRSAAADLLGVSRQSLYVKLNRYGLVRPGPAGSEAED